MNEPSIIVTQSIGDAVERAFHPSDQVIAVAAPAVAKEPAASDVQERVWRDLRASGCRVEDRDPGCASDRLCRSRPRRPVRPGVRMHGTWRYVERDRQHGNRPASLLACSMRALAISRYSDSRSIPTNEKPSRIAALPVEPEPMNGSSTTPPGGVTRRHR